MTELISKNALIVNKLVEALDKTTKDLIYIDPKLIAAEFLTVERAIEQVELFKSEVNRFESIDFKGKKFLEIGAGVGTLLIVAREKYGIDSYGIEPSKGEFSPFSEASDALLEEYNMPKDIIINGVGENIPFEDERFDFIYSTNVLEHVQDPKKVISESIRVLKTGGYLQFVIPNYFSFWEGHYAMFWPCITNKFIAKIYVQLFGRKPDYINDLQLISPFHIKTILKKFEHNIEILGWGKETFKKRLIGGNYSDWASLQKIRPIVSLIQKSGLAALTADLLNLFGMYTPIVLTLKKK